MTMALLSNAVELLDACSANVWRASWQAGLMVLAIWAIVCLVPSMPARCQCWLWRLAMLKFAVALLVPTLVDVPLLPPPVVEVGDCVEVQTPTILATPLPETDQVYTASVETNQWPSSATILRCLWLLGIGYSLLRLSFAWNSAQRLRREGCTIATGPLSEQLRTEASFVGLRHLPRMMEVRGGGSPMLFGTFRPTILMPADTCRRLSSEERAMVLLPLLAIVIYLPVA
ncbi:MAG: M56 family metallopeptidase [Thermoguttaceae bacterium]